MSSQALALDIIHRLQSENHKAYLVGGCVRDQLLGIAAKDFDVSTDARPQQLLQYFPRAQTVGAHFGVVLVRGLDSQVEVATFRSEGDYADGRHPDRVQFETDPRKDAERRDFTVNGLLQNPVTGEVLDFVGGRTDLERELIRAIGDPNRRFEEDHLRMLRAVRFAARLEFNIEPETFAAIQAHADKISKVSPERIRDELVRILTEGHADRGFELLDSTGLLQHVLPEVKAMQGVQQPPEFHPEGDVWTHVVMMLREMGHTDASLALGVLLHDVGKPRTFRVADRIRFDGHAEVGAAMASSMLQRLRFPNDQASHVTSLVANHMKFKDVRNMRVSTLKKFLCLPRFDQHLELHRLDCLCSNGYTDAYDYIAAKLKEFSKEELRPAPLITGRDLIDAGFKPGPAFGKALDAVYTAQLDGELRTRESAVAAAKELLRQF